MLGTIKVYECEKRQSKKGEDYYMVTGKMASLTTQYLSSVALSQGEHNVRIELSQYGGTTNLRIVEITK